VTRPGAGWRPRVVALDIDGTIFGAPHGSGVVDETITPAVHGAIDAVVAAGAHVVLTTGRSTFGMTPVLDLLGLPRRSGEEALAVASNGSVTFGYAPRRVPPVKILSAATFDASEVVARLLQQAPHVHVAVEEIGVGYRVNKAFPDGEITGQLRFESVEELVAEPVTRVIIRDPDGTEQDFARLVEKVGLHGINYFIGWTAWLDLAPADVSKASGLRSVCARLGVPSGDVLAIGDGRNDVEMLRWAGRGVAMGQAVDEVKAAADAVTASVHEDGVAVELARWFAP
jgi:Cof subfamily protein (haloacid dehalogenase superfamily)